MTPREAWQSFCDRVIERMSDEQKAVVWAYMMRESTFPRMLWRVFALELKERFWKP